MTIFPFPNAAAGIFIGLLTNHWGARLLLPCLWGIVWCLSCSLSKTAYRDEFIRRAAENRSSIKWHMTPLQAFYFVEYLTATAICLVISLIVGIAAGIVKRGF